MRKIVATLLSLMLIGTSILVPAYGTIEGNGTFANGCIIGEVAPDNVKQYVEDNVQDLLETVEMSKELYGLGDTSLNDLSFGEPYKIYASTGDDRDEEMYNFPIIAGGKVILVATVIRRDNELSMCVGTELVEQLNQLSIKNSNSPYLLYENQGVVYAENANEKIILENISVNENVADKDELIFEKMSYVSKLDQLVKKQYQVINPSLSSEIIPHTELIKEKKTLLAASGIGRKSSTPLAINTTTNKLLNMDDCKVNQRDQNYRQRELCWAASVASTVRYYNGVKNIHAYTVADKMGIEYWAGGTIYDMKNALSKYGITYTAKAGTITHSTLFTKIGSKRTVILGGISKLDKAHAVTVIGCISGSGITNKLTIWDSASESVKTYNNILTSFAFSSGSDVYTWRTTVY